MKEITDIVIVGVGGQGILLASSILSETALYSGYDVKANEVHGMAQRGGSVISQIRFGEKVYSPLIKSGDADILIGLEQLEAMRGLKYCNTETKAVVNTRKIMPVTVSSGNERYVENIEKELKDILNYVYIINAEKLAFEVGNIKTENVIMLGAASTFLPFCVESYESSIKKLVKPQYVDVNLKAFHKGRSLIVPV